MKKKVFSLFTAFVMIFVFVGVMPTMEVGAATNEEIRSKMINILYQNSGGSVTCDFDGYKTTPGRHEGIDFAKYNGAPVYSLIEGTVIRVDNSLSLSTLSIYDSKNDMSVIYLHSNIAVSNGSTVKQGQLIGYESNRGASAAHTHVEVRNGWQSSAAKSVKDYNLENSNPYPYWDKVLFGGDPIDRPIDNSYAVPWSGQPKATSGKITVYNVYGVPYDTSVHYIAHDDNCTIHEVYGSGFCKVEYPVSGGTHTEYAKTSDFDVPIKPLINSPSYSSIAITNGHWFFNTYESINFHATSDTATNYWIGIDRDGQRVITEQMPNGDFSISFTESGNYSAYVTAANDAGYLDSERVEFKVFSPADLGNEKIVYIENIATGLRLSVDGNVSGTENVYCSEKDNTKKQYWKLEKQSDGSYKVVLINDGRCLEVFSGGTENGTNVSVYSENSEFINQKFYFYKINDAYYIKPIFSDLFLDMDMSTYNVATWGYGEDWAPQKFQICELNKAGSSTLSVTAGSSYTDTKFSWTQSSDTNRYVVKIWKNKAWEGSAYKEFETTGTNLNVTLPAGTYQAYVDSCNDYSYTCSNVVTFTVEKGTPSSIKGDVNSDSSVGISDVVLFQKWLVKKCDLTDLINWQAADMNSDGKVDVFDMIILKRRILKR